ncbi:MAG: UDP-glucuronosyltransferase [Bacteroidales bacterium]|nr:UDP-glucuronosyltransferase [Bacteroidales bacterium]
MKILYGVPGEGMGHATRAKVIIEHLIKNHELRIVSSDRAYLFLKKAFPKETHEIKGFHFGFKDGEISKYRTFTLNLKNAPENLIVNFKKYKEIHESFKPDIIISDFESFSYFFAKQHRLPIISIDNMQVIDRAKLDIAIPDDEKNNYWVAKNVIQAKVPFSNRYLISSFFDVTIKKKDTALVPPIIRNEILNSKSSIENHILVYQSSYGKNGILELLKSMKHEKFYLYGFNKEEDHGNVQMKKFSEEEFINYFRTAKAVIANGGYSFISEAVYLKKPICAIPIPSQFEQYVNAAYVEKMEFGRMFSTLNADGIKAFLYDLDAFQEKINNYNQTDNNVLFAAIDKALQECTNL